MKMGEITWHPNRISKKDREKLLKQKGVLVWFTGLSSSGKSTIAQRLSEKLFEKKKLSYVLDGDNIRHGLNKDLGFTEQDRRENIRRVGEVAKLFVDAGVITLAAFISPYRKDRDRIRNLLGEDFIEVYVKCDIRECEKRDSKGLYKKAKKGELEDFTGISAPYEEPLSPEITVDTGKLDIEESADRIIEFLQEKSTPKQMVNYIVSGCPRSGTSMLMQMLAKAGMPIATDEQRKPDKNNVYGYLEVHDIVNKLKENPGLIFAYENKILKVVNYGLQYLPKGDYMVIYIERDLDEVMTSMEKMMGKPDREREKTKKAFESLNKKIKDLIARRDDMRVLYVKHRALLTNPNPVVDEIIEFYGIDPARKDDMLSAIDKSQYRSRKPV